MMRRSRTRANSEQVIMVMVVISALHIVATLRQKRDRRREKREDNTQSVIPQKTKYSQNHKNDYHNQAKKTREKGQERRDPQRRIRRRRRRRQTTMTSIMMRLISISVDFELPASTSSPPATDKAYPCDAGLSGIELPIFGSPCLGPRRLPRRPARRSGPRTPGGHGHLGADVGGAAAAPAARRARRGGGDAAAHGVASGGAPRALATAVRCPGATASAVRRPGAAAAVHPTAHAVRRPGTVAHRRRSAAVRRRRDAGAGRVLWRRHAAVATGAVGPAAVAGAAGAAYGAPLWLRTAARGCVGAAARAVGEGVRPAAPGRAPAGPVRPHGHGGAMACEFVCPQAPGPPP